MKKEAKGMFSDLRTTLYHYKHKKKNVRFRLLHWGGLQFGMSASLMPYMIRVFGKIGGSCEETLMMPEDIYYSYIISNQPLLSSNQTACSRTKEKALFLVLDLYYSQPFFKKKESPNGAQNPRVLVRNVLYYFFPHFFLIL